MTKILDLTLNDSLMILLAYLIGSISPGYLLVRMLRDVDLRTIGSPMSVVVAPLVAAVIILIAHRNNIMQVWFTSEHKA